MRALKTFTLACVCLLVAACGDSNSPAVVERTAVKGQVTLDGQPLEAAVISFISEPLRSADGGSLSGTRTIVASGLISRGAYEISREYGPAQGHNRVEITPQGKELESYVAEQQASGRKRLSPFVTNIPDRYHARTTLAVEVSPSREPLVFDFNLSGSSR